MPNPRAQKPLSYEQIIKDAKSLGVPAQALLDALAGGVKGSVSATVGAPADIYNLINQASFRGQLPTAPYGSEDISKMLPDVVPTEDKSRKHSAEYGEFAGSFIPTPMAGQALKGAVKLGAKGARALGEEAGRRAVMGESFTPFVNTAIPQTNVIKPKGGNWFTGEVEKPLDSLLTKGIISNQEIPFGPDFDVAIRKRIEDLKQAASQPDYKGGAGRVAERLEEELKNPRSNEVALNKWVQNNLTNYIKKDMGTPEDPVRLMIDNRINEINNKFNKDIARADKVAQRAIDEVDPRKQANLQREANRLRFEAENERDLSTKHVAHMPLHEDYANFDEMRAQEGFPSEGMGKSLQAKNWENFSDNAIYPKKAGSIQGLNEKLAQAELAKKEILQAKENLNAKVSTHLKEKGLNLPEEQEKKFIDGMSFDEKERLVGDNVLQEAYAKLHKLESFDDDYNLKRLEKNPWVNKLSPDTSIYSAQTGNLEFSHILDVLKEDLASGRMNPEELKNISMEQAVRKTADYDLALAKKMQEAQAKNLENMTVHKEYPEGLKWVQLDKPGQFAAESNAMGHSVRGYEPPEGHPDWIPESGDSGSEYYGHGGWEAIKNKEAKVYSLVDSKGNPHTTVEVKANQNPYPVSGEAFAMLPQSTKAQYGQYVREWRQRNPHIEDLTDEHTTQALKEAGVPPQPDSITQIKGKGNGKIVDSYIPYVQDFVKSGNWGDVGDIKNTGLYKLDKDFLGQVSAYMPEAVDIQHLKRPQREEAILKAMDAGDLKSGYITRNEYESAIRKHGLPTYGEVTDDLLNQLQAPVPPVEGMKRGGAVHISDNPDTMYMELMDKKMKGGGAEDDTKLTPSQWLQAQANKPIEPFTPIEDLTTNLKGLATAPARLWEGAQKLVADPKAYFEGMKAPTAEEMAMAFNPAHIGIAGVHLPSTPTKPNPLVGTRYQKQYIGGLAPRKNLDIEDLEKQKASVKIFPWDATSRNQLITEVSDIPLIKPVLTEGGDEYMLDLNHIANRIAGASNEGIAKRIQDRTNQASMENKLIGGSGRVYGFSARMGEGAENAATAPTSIVMDLLKQANLKKGELKALDSDMRNMMFEGKKDIFKNMAPIGTPEFENQLLEGLASNKEKELQGFTSMNMRKALMDRLGKVEYQKRLGYNLPDLTGAVLADELKGIPKGYVGNMASELDPFTQIRPSKSSAYSHDFSGQYAGSMPNMPLEFLMPHTYEGIYFEMKTKYPKATPEALRNMTIGAMEKRKEGISEMISPRSVDATKVFQEGLKNGEFDPNDIKQVYDFMRRKKLQLKLKDGGEVHVKPKKMAKGGEISEDDIQMEVRPL